MFRLFLIGILALLISPTNAQANSTEIQSIQDICYDAPEWLIELDTHEPLWLTKNLVNSTVSDWEDANYLEKMATLAVYLIAHEYKRDSVISDDEIERDSGYHCSGIIDLLDKEIGKHSLPKDFPVWECVEQVIELDSGTESISLSNSYGLNNQTVFKL